MKISIIIPFYKEIDLIGRATESVVSNVLDLCDFEIIICNDGNFSENEIRSRLLIDVNCHSKIFQNRYAKGPGGARNTGLDAATGELIAFLDADDYWLPRKIELQIAAIRSNATFVVTGYCLDVNGGKIMPPQRIKRAEDIFMLRGIGTSTVLVDKRLVEDLRFRNIRFGQDIDFWYALAKQSTFKYVSIEEVLVVYSTSGSTRNKFVQLKYFHQILCLNGLGFGFRARSMFSYIATGVFNHYIKRLFNQVLKSSSMGEAKR